MSAFIRILVRIFRKDTEYLSVFNPNAGKSDRKFSRDWLISFFLKIGMVLGVHVYLYVTEPVILEKIPIGQKWLKMAQKHGFWTF